MPVDPSAKHTTVAPSTSRCTPLKVSCVRSLLIVTTATPDNWLPVMTAIRDLPLGAKSQPNNSAIPFSSAAHWKVAFPPSTTVASWGWVRNVTWARPVSMASHHYSRHVTAEERMLHHLPPLTEKKARTVAIRLNVIMISFSHRLLIECEHGQLAGNSPAPLHPSYVHTRTDTRTDTRTCCSGTTPTVSLLNWERVHEYLGYSSCLQQTLLHSYKHIKL